MKKKNKKINIKNDERREYIIVFLFTFVFSLFFYHNTFFYRSSIQNIDNFIFYNCSYFIDRGLIVYKDFIDNKGPLLYLINFFEYKFDNIHMVYFMTLFLHYITNIYVYKIARIKLNIKYSFVVMFFANTFFISMLEEHLGSLTGTMSEFYAMPIFSYIYYKYLKSNNYTNVECMFFGALCAVLFFLRVNLISISIVTSILILYNYKKHKKYDLIKKYIIYFLMGIILVTTPIIIYFICNGAIKDMFDSYILFNIKYSSVSDQNSPLIIVLFNYFTKSFKTFVDFSKNIFILSIFCIYITDFINTKKINLNFIIFVFCYFVAIFVSNRYYMHYIWVLMPLASVPFTNLFENNKISKYYLSINILIVISSLFFILYALKHDFVDKINDKGFGKEYYDMINSVNSITTDNNAKVFGAIALNNHFYKDIYKMPSGDYVLQYDQKFMYDEFTNKFKDNLPEIVVYEKYKRGFSEEWKIFLEKELKQNYILRYKNDKYEVYKINK